MPRKFLKRIMPDHVAMREHRHLQRFGEKIMAPELWHLNRKSVSAAIAVGLFIGFIPIPGQMFVAAAIAIWLRLNLPVAVMGVWVTNPLTMAPIYFFCYKIGAMILEVPIRTHEFAFSLEWLWHELELIWQPLLLGAFICGTLAAIAGVVIVRLIWRIVVINSWLKRYRRQNRDLSKRK